MFGNDRKNWRRKNGIHQMKTVVLKIIPGDGIGREVVSAGKDILRTIEALHGGVRFDCEDLAWGCEYYLRHGCMMPNDGMRHLDDCDAVLLGAVGGFGVPDHVSLHGLLLPIRQGFDQYINMRPVKLLEGLASPLKNRSRADIDFVIIRENSEGEYCGRGRIENRDTAEETAVQEACFSRKGTERVIKYAFEYARRHQQKKITSATKSNALNYSMVFWDAVFNEVKKSYQDIEAQSIHMDALAGLFLLRPQQFDVIVASNLFGDILTDLGAAMLGSIGVSPSANINPEKKHPSMFEPVHGSAPDIAGTGIANPIGMIWSIVLMLEHLGMPVLSEKLMGAVETVLSAGKVRTPDLGGTGTTGAVAEEIKAVLRSNLK